MDGARTAKGTATAGHLMEGVVAVPWPAAATRLEEETGTTLLAAAVVGATELSPEEEGRGGAITRAAEGVDTDHTAIQVPPRVRVNCTRRIDYVGHARHIPQWLPPPSRLWAVCTPASAEQVHFSGAKRREVRAQTSVTAQAPNSSTATVVVVSHHVLFCRKPPSPLYSGNPNDRIWGRAPPDHAKRCATR